MPKKKKDFKFFWEELEKAGNVLDEPMEFSFTIPGFGMPEIKAEKTIPIHVAETDSEVVVRAELPGFGKNEIMVNVTESYVEITAAKKTERVEKTEKIYLQERKAGTLRRAFSLPAKVDPDTTEARMENGVLSIVLPKLYPVEKKKRRIDIR